jgi:hypothetical protein
MIELFNWCVGVQKAAGEIGTGQLDKPYSDKDTAIAAKVTATGTP